MSLDVLIFSAHLFPFMMKFFTFLVFLNFSMNTKFECGFINIKTLSVLVFRFGPIFFFIAKRFQSYSYFLHTIIIKFSIFATSQSLWLCLSVILCARVFVTCIQTMKCICTHKFSLYELR